MFLREFFLRHKETGAVAPSSQRLARLIVDAAGVERAHTIIELGAGTGVFTREICARKSGEASVYALEINSHFVKQLETAGLCAEVWEGSLRDLSAFMCEAHIVKADCIVSGIPWANFSSEEQRDFMREIVRALSDDGVFVTFAYTPFHILSPRGRAFRDLLCDTFECVERTRTVLNTPPAFVYVCRIPRTDLR